MYIRKTTTKKASDGIPYTTFRIVSSERVQGKVKQRTILNIGSCFDLDERLWSQLCKKIDDILVGNISLIPPPYEVEKYAQEFAARITAERSIAVTENAKNNELDRFEEIDVTSLQLLSPRSVGVEHVALHGAQMLQLPDILKKVGLTQPQVTLALGSIVARMAKPDSEKGTWDWLTGQSALEELLDVDFSRQSIMGLYRVSDLLVHHKKQIEELLFARIFSIFSPETTVTLYDLTNTYFEGGMKRNGKAARGHSKEKRSDCPLLTLGLVLEGNGFVRKSQVFSGNVSEPKTLQSMLKELAAPPGALVVMDRGIATEAVLAWLVSNNYRYVVVSRERARIFDMSKAQTIRSAQGQDLHIYREVNAQETEARLYCYSPQRAAKEEGIAKRFTEKFETGLNELAARLASPRGNKRKDKILHRIGRLAEKSRGISQHYTITVADNADTKDPSQPLLATSIQFERKPVVGSCVTHPGVYCLRTNALWLEAEQLWRTYIRLTDLEAVFRSLKSELGLRPVYHQTSERAEGHLFITVLAYQCVQAIRNKLKKHDIYDSWGSLRDTLCTQQRVTATFQQRNGTTLHIRKASVAEAGQQRLYEALRINNSPGGIKRYSVPLASKTSM